MKDRQTDLSGQQAHIPVISPLLHWLAMPALVCLRSSFGYLYLRPKSIFLSFSFAFTLLFIVAWNEPALWAGFALPVCFAFAVSILYVLHLFTAVRKQVGGGAEHDTFSGNSHLGRIMSAFSPTRREDLELHLHLWIEPLLVLAAAFRVRVILREHFLATWLTIMAGALFAKELRNYWSEIRKKKRKGDMHSDTEEEADEHLEKPEPEMQRGVRKPKRKRSGSAN